MDSVVSFKSKVCVELKPSSCGVVIFGASGDLTARKLIPSLFSLFTRKLLPDNFYVLGCARTSMSVEQFREKVLQPLRSHPDSEDAGLDTFARHLFYLSGDYRQSALYRDMVTQTDELNRRYKTDGTVMFYLAVPPVLYSPIIQQLGNAGLTARKEAGDNRRRVVIEKPFGDDLPSSIELGRVIRNTLSENQIYRIDHYLGKETVQNILMLRFANIVFEPVWNRQYIDSIQITVAESIGVEHRAGYFEKTGLLRDMFQNHMLLMLSLIAMEPPSSFAADCVRNEKVKLLNAIRPFPIKELSRWVVRGQYTQTVGETHVIPGYREEKGVAPASMTETFVAAKLLVENWRWQGVPFYLRSGKRLPRRVSEIAIVFKQVPHSIFLPLLPEHLSPNVLVLNVQPHEGVSLKIQAKQPGPKLCMGDLKLKFLYRDVFGGEPPEAYERLLLDVMLGDQTLFVRQDTIEMAWSLLTPVLDSWEKEGVGAGGGGTLYPYRAGTWGPLEADRLLEHDGRSWKEPE